ncbi:MAG: hypothetical protein JXX14_00980 [Deltaproteobacteria bacterium]|nr:hypothetical protein [Deltaproteobacteria bacterium]
MGLLQRSVMSLYLLSLQIETSPEPLFWIDNLLLLAVGSGFLYLTASGGSILWKIVDKIAGK